jgi:hypothetical protein
MEDGYFLVDQSGKLRVGLASTVILGSVHRGSGGHILHSHDSGSRKTLLQGWLLPGRLFGYIDDGLSQHSHSWL